MSIIIKYQWWNVTKFSRICTSLKILVQSIVHTYDFYLVTFCLSYLYFLLCYISKISLFTFYNQVFFFLHYNDINLTSDAHWPHQHLRTIPL